MTDLQAREQATICKADFQEAAAEVYDALGLARPPPPHCAAPMLRRRNSVHGECQRPYEPQLADVVGGRRIPSRQHLAFDPKNNEPIAKLFVSMLQRLGLEVDQFASQSGTLRGLEQRQASGSREKPQHSLPLHVMALITETFGGCGDRPFCGMDYFLDRGSHPRGLQPSETRHIIYFEIEINDILHPSLSREIGAVVVFTRLTYRLITSVVSTSYL